MAEKLIVLHADDKPDWLDNVANQLKTLKIRGRPREVIVLSRVSVAEARDLLDGEDKQMQSLAADGHRLAAVIIDLMMGGGKMQEVERWLTGIRSMRTTKTGADLPSPAFQEFDNMCPTAQIGRKARKVGVPVVILTNVSKFMPAKELSLAAERKLIMTACGASQYIVKTDGNWPKQLNSALETLIS